MLLNLPTLKKQRDPPDQDTRPKDYPWMQQGGEADYRPHA